MIDIDKLTQEIISPLIFNEGKNIGTIYHFTGPHSIWNILSQNELKGSKVDLEYAHVPGSQDSDELISFRKDINALKNKDTKYIYYVSTTRNRLLYKKNTTINSDIIRISLDGNKLSNKYKIVPFYYFSQEMNSNDVAPKDVQDESEERILLFTKPSIPNLSEYILDINIILDKVKGYSHVSYIKDLIEEYPELKSKTLYKEKYMPFTNFIEQYTEYDEEEILEENNNNNVETNILNENKLYSPDINTIKNIIYSLTKFLKKELTLDSLPNVKFITNDETNAIKPLGKTAYYDPNSKCIVLYTLGRHPKDIGRSFSHEMIHFNQDLENRLNNISTQNINEDDYLKELEREAYEKGNMLFRSWENSI